MTLYRKSLHQSSWFHFLWNASCPGRRSACLLLSTDENDEEDDDDDDDDDDGDHDDEPKTSVLGSLLSCQTMCVRTSGAQRTRCV